ncbi:MAG: hypothetical protein U9N34_10070 [Candidatus Cloacimonadota bacterium]|nr:hypothetical protein [Candidatus Cloacimonadota bacterium]
MKSLRVNLTLILILLIGSVSLFAAPDSVLLSKKISLDAEDASLGHVITTMAKQSNCNIVLAMEFQETKDGDGETKNITIHLKDIPVEQAVALVVKSVGLSYRIIGENTFLIGDRRSIEEEIGERTYIVNLNYIDPLKVEKALKILPGDSVALEGQNAILIKANPETFLEINNRIKEMDVPLKQIEVRARLIEVIINKAETMGIDWQKLNRLTTIIAEDPTTADGLGLPFNYSDETGALPHGDASSFGAMPEEQYWQKMSNFSDVGHFSRQLSAFDITIDWLLKNNAAKLLTDTRVTTMNGQEALIHIGEEIPYVARSTADDYVVSWANVGVMLRVKPTVNKDGQITTWIEPEVSSVVELVNGNLPRKKIRKISSTVTVPEGKKIHVGGLLSSNLNHTTNKVPFFGDLPWVGKFFTHKAEIIENTDLIIEITPSIVSATEKELEIDERLDVKLIKEIQE